MAVVQKSLLLMHSAESMFALIERVEDYPQFLPWCGGTQVLEREPGRLVATLHINYRGVRQSFTTENRVEHPVRMDMTLRDGPFHILDGGWKLTPLRDDACKVEFRLHYEFSSKLLESVVGPVFSHIAGSFVDAFIKRADTLYRS